MDSAPGRQDKVAAPVPGAGFFKKTIRNFLGRAVRILAAHPATIHRLHLQDIEFKCPQIDVQ
jgi:hypothetical protein